MTYLQLNESGSRLAQGISSACLGGPSGASAAAVASGIFPLAHANDGGGFYPRSGGFVAVWWD